MPIDPSQVSYSGSDNPDILNTPLPPPVGAVTALPVAKNPYVNSGYTVAVTRRKGLSPIVVALGLVALFWMLSRRKKR